MHFLDRCRGRIYDLMHNVDTYRKMPIDDLAIIGNNKQFGTAYRVTLPVDSLIPYAMFHGSCLSEKKAIAPMP